MNNVLNNANKSTNNNTTNTNIIFFRTSLIIGNKILRGSFPKNEAVFKIVYIGLRDAAKKCASSKTLISKVKFIVEILGLQKVKDLYDGKPVSVGGSVTTTVNRLYTLAVEQDDAERKARSFNEPMPMPEVIKASSKYIAALSKEHQDVIDYVSKWGWREGRK